MTARTAQIARARARTVALMTDTCVIGPEVATGPLDPVTGLYPTGVDPVYEGPCEFVAEAVVARDVDLQAQQLTIRPATLKIPVDAPGAVDVQAGHRAVVTLADTVVTARIRTRHDATFATARRFPVEVIT